jgi:uncharacterized protein DUF4007
MHDLPSMSAEKRLGPSFHRTFAFNRSAVSALLSLALRYESDPKVRITKDVVKKETLLGVQYVESMPRYARAAGLLDSDNRLTPLGSRVATHDISLERKETLWLIHYNLSRRDGLAPRFWGYLFEEIVHPGDRIERDRVSTLIREISQSHQAVRISDSTAADAATVFLKTYSSCECLGGLSVLQKDSVDGSYLVLEPEPPPALVFGLVVADYWAKNLRDTTSAWIDEFNKAGGPAQVLLMGLGDVNHAMRELSRMGLATVQLTQPPYQFSPLWKNRDELLDRIYWA